DRGPRAHQALRRRPRRRRPELRRPARQGDRLPRAQRGGEVDDDADGARPRPAHRRVVAGQRAAVRLPRRTAPGSGRAPGTRLGPRRPDRTGTPVRGRPDERHPATAGRRGDRPGRSRPRGAPAHQGLLPRHAAAARDRRRAARGPAGAALRRAGQRPGPRRRALDPGAAAAARGRGPHRPGLQPPAQRDASDRRPPGRHRAGPADRRRDDGGHPARAGRRPGPRPERPVRGTPHRSAGARAQRHADGLRRARGRGRHRLRRRRGGQRAAHPAAPRHRGGPVPRGRLPGADRQQRAVRRLGAGGPQHGGGTV
ncbi:MAG: Efflux ABC transporter, ATP-binding protein, partial [uncultured Blastococcus sp.]